MPDAQLWLALAAFVLTALGAVVAVTRSHTAVQGKVGALAGQVRDGFGRIDGRLDAQDASIARQGEGLTKVMTVLTGIDGMNGINGEVKALRHARHQDGNLLHTTAAKVSELERRVAAGEERSGR